MGVRKCIAIAIVLCSAVVFCLEAAEPVAVETLMKQAAQFGREKKYAEAEPLLRTVIQLEPANAQAHYSLALVYLRTDRPHEAAQEYLKVSELDEKLATALRKINPMFSLVTPAKGIATESGFITAPAPVIAPPTERPDELAPVPQAPMPDSEKPAARTGERKPEEEKEVKTEADSAEARRQQYVEMTESSVPEQQESGWRMLISLDPEDRSAYEGMVEHCRDRGKFSQMRHYLYKMVEMGWVTKDECDKEINDYQGRK